MKDSQKVQQLDTCWIPSLSEITQFDFEKVGETGSFAHLNITKENWYYLYDLYVVKIGQEHELKRKCKKLVDYIEVLETYILSLDPSDEMDYLIISNEMQTKVNDSKVEIEALLTEHYHTFLDKKILSVESYTNHYLRLVEKLKQQQKQNG